MHPTTAPLVSALVRLWKIPHVNVRNISWLFTIPSPKTTVQMLNKTRSLIGLDSTAEMELLCFFLIFWLVVFHRNKGSNFFQYWIKKSIIGQFSLSHSYTFIIVAIVPAVYYLFLTIWKSRHCHIGISIVTGIDSGIQIEKFYFYFQNFFLKKQNIYVLSCP